MNHAMQKMGMEIVVQITFNVMKKKEIVIKIPIVMWPWVIDAEKITVQLVFQQTSIAVQKIQNMFV